MAKVKIPFTGGTFEIKFSCKFTPDKHTARESVGHKPFHKNEENNSNKKKYHQNNCVPQEKMPTVLVLFIKADSASTLIDSIKQNGRLYKGVETVLFVNAMKMWVGNDSQYNTSVIKNEFTRSENADSFVKEYDYIAMRFELNKDYNGYNKNDDSYERNEFFTQICNDEIKLVECSKRLAFDSNCVTEAYNVY